MTLKTPITIEHGRHGDLSIVDASETEIGLMILDEGDDESEILKELVRRANLFDELVEALQFHFPDGVSEACISSDQLDRIESLLKRAKEANE